MCYLPILLDHKVKQSHHAKYQDPSDTSLSLHHRKHCHNFTLLHTCQCKVKNGNDKLTKDYKSWEIYFLLYLNEKF